MCLKNKAVIHFCWFIYLSTHSFISYTGLALSFFSGVYSTCVGSTLRFSDPARLVGISGMCLGIGEISGDIIIHI